jgi:hypothetical protein
VSDYIKRLETLAGALDCFVEFGGNLISKEDAAMVAQDLRSLLSDVERMRELVGGLIDLDDQTPGGLKDSTNNDGKPYQSAFLDALLDTIARQALSAPNTEEGE